MINIDDYLYIEFYVNIYVKQDIIRMYKNLNFTYFIN